MEHKKHFSKMGLVLLLSTLVIYIVQTLADVITVNVPAIAESGDLSFLMSMLPMYIIAYPIIFRMFKRIPVQLTGEKKKMHPLHLFVAFLIGYAGAYICNIFANILTMIIGIIKQSPVDNVMMNVTSNISPLVSFLIIAICAPIMEELLFRKTLIDRTAKYGEGVSLVFSGLVFGLFHGNLVQFTYAFLIGCFFGFIYIKTKNIIYPIILHMITNFLGSLGTTLIMDVSGLMEIAELTTAGASDAELMAVMMEHAGGLVAFFFYFLCLIGFVIAGIVLFFVNLRKFKLTPGEVTIAKGKRFSTVILNLGMILYCVFWIVKIILQLVE